MIEKRTMVTGRLIAAFIGVAFSITPGADLLAQGRMKAAASTTPTPPRSVIQKLRSFLGLNPPVMQQPNFGQQQRQPSQRGYGHSSGSYFGY